MLPPHEIVARGSGVSPKTTSSVLEGVGRTLKGRDLRQASGSVRKKYDMKCKILRCLELESIGEKSSKIDKTRVSSRSLRNCRTKSFNHNLRS
ncbi:hypothetical protein K1719_000173 [Acacia pycnantha]|nr:hypothetical protein K1719_000173 [Acacia pycnantha]